LPAQDGELMSHGDEFEFQRGAVTSAEREQMGYWGSPVRRELSPKVGDGLICQAAAVAV
jgi:hypothetical protein